jgi:methionine sulfoxide reductase heme-binding subunit
MEKVHASLPDIGGKAPPKTTSPRFRALKPATFLLCLLPLAKLAFDVSADELTANPIEAGMNRLGFWALSFLIASLAASPMKALFGWTWPLRVRRMVGLFAFFYAALHLTTYVALDQAFALRDIGLDIVKRPFITIGLAAFIVLVPLAVTSTDRAVRKLGFRRWKRIHRLVYLAAILAIVHFVWRVKADLLVPGLYGVLLAALLGVRLALRRPKRAASAPAEDQGFSRT